jgi:hypothetical protein
MGLRTEICGVILRDRSCVKSNENCHYIHRGIIIMGKAQEDFSHHCSWCLSVWELAISWVKVQLLRQLAMMLPLRPFTS